MIAAALGGTYAWAQTQYYVGKAGTEVAIYKGVNASFGPLKFSEVYENTDLKLDDLNPSWQAQVESGITAKSESDARNIVQRLHGELKPLCRPDRREHDADGVGLPVADDDPRHRAQVDAEVDTPQIDARSTHKSSAEGERSRGTRARDRSSHASHKPSPLDRADLSRVAEPVADRAEQLAQREPAQAAELQAGCT